MFDPGPGGDGFGDNFGSPGGGKAAEADDVAVADHRGCFVGSEDGERGFHARMSLAIKSGVSTATFDQTSASFARTVARKRVQPTP